MSLDISKPIKNIGYNSENWEQERLSQEKTVTPTTAIQNVTPDGEYKALSKVTVEAVTSNIDSNIQADNIKKGVTILGVDGTLESGGGEIPYEISAKNFTFEGSDCVGYTGDARTSTIIIPKSYSIKDGVVVDGNDVIVDRISSRGGRSGFEYFKGNIVLLDNITLVLSDAFNYCYGLKSVTIGNKVRGIGHKAFYGCSSLTSITIPDSVGDIGQSAFDQCSNLSSVVIGSGMKSIEDFVFIGCSKLTEMTILATTPPRIKSRTISNATTSIYVPDASVEAYKTASVWSTYADKIKPLSSKPA